MQHLEGWYTAVCHSSTEFEEKTPTERRKMGKEGLKEKERERGRGEWGGSNIPLVLVR